MVGWVAFLLRVREVSGLDLVKDLLLFIQQSGTTCSRWFLARGCFYHEYGGDTFLRNVGSHKIYTKPHARRRCFS
jgi:hypothetical protein